MPHLCHDPVVAAAGVINSLQTLVSRTVSPTDPCVVSITRMQAGSEAYNVIPTSVFLGGTFRCFSHKLRLEFPGLMNELVECIARGHNAVALIDWKSNGFPPTINSPLESQTAFRAAVKTVGRSNVSTNYPASMGAEDFSYMLQEKKGCYVFVGAGEDAFPLHHPKYDANDAIIPIGAEMFVNMAMESLCQDLESECL